MNEALQGECEEAEEEETDLSEDEGGHVDGLPVGGVEEVGQGHGGEGRQHVRAVQGVVQTLRAPPAAGD